MKVRRAAGVPALRLRRALGLSLIELLVALAIGAFLMFGATQVYVDSRRTYDTNETVARLQETARFAMSVLEPDVRMANHFGLIKGGESFDDVNTPAQTAAASPSWSELTACGNNFVTDLKIAIQADDNTCLLTWSGGALPATCSTVTQPDGSAWTSTPVVTADTLTVRRASALALDLPSTVDWLQVCSTRTKAWLIWDGSQCTDVAQNGLAEEQRSQRLNNLSVNAYYVDQNSSQAVGLPSLRRKTLIHPPGAKSRLADEEIAPGVEDMQVQIGIERVPGVGLTAVATEYLNPVDYRAAVVAAAAAGQTLQVVAVRVWLLVRSDTLETGFTDNRVYAYGDRSVANGTTGDLDSAAAAGKAYRPDLSGDAGPGGRQHFRRLLVSRTFQLRNSMGT